MFRWSTLRFDHRLLSLEPFGLTSARSGDLRVGVEFGEEFLKQWSVFFWVEVVFAEHLEELAFFVLAIQFLQQRPTKSRHHDWIKLRAGIAAQIQNNFIKGAA